MRLYDIDPGLSKAKYNDLRRQFTERGSLGFETRFRRKDGSVFPVDVNSNLFAFEGNRYSISFIRDLTEKMKHENQKAAMEAHLRQAQRMEALGTLAGGVAHDFNNIIAAIYGYSELAQLRCPEKSKLRNYVEQIATACIRAKNLVQQILTFSRRGITEKRLINISSVVEEALTLIRATFPSTIEIRQDLAAGLRDVLADETQIHQVVMNLCTNAYQAMGNDGGLLEISLTAVTVGNYDSSCYPVVSPGRYLKLIVADTGKGMEPAQMERIFDPYFTTKKPGEGTGMGLSTVHGIVKDHGGSIKVYSQPGVGTTIQVFFPLAKNDFQPSRADTASFSPGRGVILFVDDEEQLRDIGSELLEGLGYLVETRVDPMGTIEAFRLNPLKYDLLITDWTMPQMTGGKLARKVRKIRPDIPIILCTGLPAAIDDVALKEVGVRHVLPKPVALNRLAAAVTKTLEDRPVNR
jgi:signal transduction histidine kinase/CheY-like chemotaxis protein